MKPRLAIVLVETIEHTLAAQALAQTLRAVDPAQVIIFTDRRDIWPQGSTIVPIAPLDATTGHARANRLLTHALPRFLQADHALHIGPAAFVWQPGAYDAGFCAVDHVGPAGLEDGTPAAGATGIWLRSRRLVEAVAALPYEDAAEDESLFVARRAHDVLSARGLKFASAALSQRFAWSGPAAGAAPAQAAGLPSGHTPSDSWAFTGWAWLPAIYREHLDFLVEALSPITLKDRGDCLATLVEALSPALAQRLRTRMAKAGQTALQPHPQPHAAAAPASPRAAPIPAEIG
jgi:hypothetical protein